MGRIFVIAAIGILLMAFGYGLGTFAESYSLNQCYALSLQMLGHRGERVAASKSDAALVRFRKLVRALPLNGSSTSCKRVQVVLDVPYKAD